MGSSRLSAEVRCVTWSCVAWRGFWFRSVRRSRYMVNEASRVSSGRPGDSDTRAWVAPGDSDARARPPPGDSDARARPAPK